MVGRILYDGTGLPHARRYAPRPEPEVVVPTVESFTVTAEMVAVSPEFIALATGLPVDEAVDSVDGGDDSDEKTAEDAQEPAEEPESEPEADLPADAPEGAASGDSKTEDAGAATLAALGL
jgi:hypothetical protein